MSVSIAEILKLIEGVIDAEKKIATAINSEKDAARRAKLLKACKDRDLEAIKEILYAVE
jgi:uncharacterized protein YjaG (DUF416 family)